jgi:hypothetical protein
MLTMRAAAYAAMLAMFSRDSEQLAGSGRSWPQPQEAPLFSPFELADKRTARNMRTMTAHRILDIAASVFTADSIVAASSEIDSLAARASALFVSDLSARRDHSRAEIATAITRGLRSHGGVRGCVGEVAAAYGEHPETAVPRMRWARSAIEHTCSSAAGHPPAVRRPWLQRLLNGGART